jgi:hypothetical protein
MFSMVWLKHQVVRPIILPVPALKSLCKFPILRIPLPQKWEGGERSSPVLQWVLLPNTGA